MANINQRPSFMIEDLLECHRKLEEAKRQRAREYEAEMQRSLEQFYHMSQHGQSALLNQSIQPPFMFPHHQTTLGPHFNNLPSTSYLATKSDIPDYRRFSAGEMPVPPSPFYSQHLTHIDSKASPHLFKTYMYPSPVAHTFATSNYFLGSPKRKGGQVRFTAHQTQVLEKRFISHKYLSPEERRNLALQLQLSDRQVKTWFQNRRAKYRRASCPDDLMHKDNNKLLLNQSSCQNLVRLRSASRSTSPATNVVGFQQERQLGLESRSTNLTLLIAPHTNYQSETSSDSSASSDNEIDLNHMD